MRYGRIQADTRQNVRLNLRYRPSICYAQSLRLSSRFYTIFQPRETARGYDFEYALSCDHK